MSALFSVGERRGHKYYGTDILWGGRVIGAIWHHDDDSKPSVRELEYCGPGVTEEMFLEECCDSHWESQQNFEEALELTKRLNALHQHS